MISKVTVTYMLETREPIRLEDLRKLCDSTAHLSGDTPVKINKIEGDQRDPSYNKISVLGPERP